MTTDRGADGSNDCVMRCVRKVPSIANVSRAASRCAAFPFLAISLRMYGGRMQKIEWRCANLQQ
jgi:hypothetical protein